MDYPLIQIQSFKRPNIPQWKSYFPVGGMLPVVAYAGAKKVMNNFAEGAYPYGYNPMKILQNGVLGIKDRRLSDPQYNTSAMRERRNLLQMLVNKPQISSDSLLQSKYTPSNAVDSKAKYYSSPETEGQLRLSMQNPSYVDSVKTGKLRTELSPSLGNYSVGYGNDKQGDYLSYYDKWDLNPIPQSGVKWLDKFVDKAVTQLPQTFGLTNVPEVYGRVYINKNK